MLQKCDTVPEGGFGVADDTKNLEAHKECLAALSDTFVFDKTLGAGANGVVLGVKHKKISENPYLLAVKITSLIYGISEIRIACMINRLLEECVIFNETVGWIICDQIPESWMNHMFTRSLSEMLRVEKRLLFLVQSRNQYTFDELAINDNEGAMRAGLFLMLHGFGTARKQFAGFDHADIHAGNLMWTKNTAADSLVVVKMGGREFHVRAPFIPKLIDFGNSSFGKQWQSHDLGNLVLLFVGYARGIGKQDFFKFSQSATFAYAAQWDSATFEVDVLLHEFFEPVVKAYDAGELEPNQKRLKMTRAGGASGAGGAAGLQFVDEETQQVVSQENLVSRYAVALEKTILRERGSAAKRVLGLLEKTSKPLANFIAQFRMWAKLVERDYPQQYKYSKTPVVRKNAPDLRLMRQETRAKLDTYSERPNREHTYWKRYYELLTRTNLSFDRILDRKTVQLKVPISAGAVFSEEAIRFYVAAETVDILKFDGVETFYIFEAGLAAASAAAILQVDLSAAAGAGARKISVTTIEHKHTDKMINSRWKRYPLDFDEDAARWRTFEGFEELSVTLNSANRREFEIQVGALGESFDEDEEEQQQQRRQLVSMSFYQ